MADLTCFATQDNANDGVWFPVKLYGLKVPLALLIYGDDSDKVAAYNREKLRKIKIGQDGKAKLDDDELDELLDSADDNIIVRIGGISSYDWEKGELTKEPVVLFEKTLANEPKSYRFLIEKIPAVKDFVKEKSNERTSFLSERKKS